MTNCPTIIITAYRVAEVDTGGVTMDQETYRTLAEAENHVLIRFRPGDSMAIEKVRETYCSPELENVEVVKTIELYGDIELLNEAGYQL